MLPAKDSLKEVSAWLFWKAGLNVAVEFIDEQDGNWGGCAIHVKKSIVHAVNGEG